MYRSIIFSQRLLYQTVLHSKTTTMMLATVRTIATTEFTKNITLFSNEKKPKGDNFRIENQGVKPLVVMMSWMLSKKKHISKYAEFYIQRGCDVVCVNITPWQLLWPLKGSQVVASDIIKFLYNNNTYSPLLIHGFSVGGYVWAEALVQMAADQDRYRPVLNRFVGQVWDSLADITEIPHGFPFAVFPNSKTLQSAFRQYLLFHLKSFDEAATRHYMLARQTFHNNLIRAPALLFVSKTDPVGSERSNLLLKQNWENIGMTVAWKCWDDSPHVMHFYRHPEEYHAELCKFLERIALPPEKDSKERLSLKAKL